MNPLLRLESMLRDAFERPVWALGGQRFHPAQLAALLEDAMRSGRVGLPGGTYVPEQYVLLVNPQDLARFGKLQTEVESGLKEHLDGLMAVEGYGRRAPLSVTMQADDGVRLGQVEVDATFAESVPRATARPAGQGNGVELDPGLPPGATMAIDRSAVMAAIEVREIAEPTGDAIAVLAELDGNGRERRRYGVETLPCLIGRAPDCDVILSDLRVSRHHARIVRDRDGLVVEDLHSANGVWLNGERRERTAVSEGDTIGLGGPRFRVYVTA
jgi:hypothetical protein